MVEARESDGSFEEYFEEESTIWGTWVTNPDVLYHAVECNRSLNSSEGPFEVSCHCCHEMHPSPKQLPFA